MSTSQHSALASTAQPTTRAARKGHQTDTQMAASQTQNAESNGPQNKPTDRSIDLRLIDYPITIENADLLEALFYEHDFSKDDIAAFVPEPVSTDDVRRKLRSQQVLNPWDDPHVLEACYEGYDMSTTEIAETVCDGQLTAETVRVRLHDFGILSEKSQKLLEKMDPEDLDLSPTVDDLDGNYRLRGPDSSDNGGASA